MGMTQTTSTDTEQRPTDEQVFRAAILAQCNMMVREHGDAALLEMIEALPGELQEVVLGVLDWDAERQG